MNNKFDLSDKKGTAANIIRDNMDKFNSCRSKEDVIALCHTLFDDAGVDTNWSRVFFIKLNATKGLTGALQYVTNAYLRGSGLGLNNRRYYEGEEINESMSSSDVEEFKKKLKAGEVKFKYTKKDGSEREALGTLDPKLMNLPEKKTSNDIDKASNKQKKVRKLPSDSVFYYDLEAKGFRSFKMSNFVDYL